MLYKTSKVHLNKPYRDLRHWTAKLFLLIASFCGIDDNKLSLDEL